MRRFLPGLTLAGIAVLLFSACGGGGDGGGSGSSSSSSGGVANVAPTANAGAMQSVGSGVTVTLNGTASSDSDGTIATYLWTQTAGAAVSMSSNSAAQPTFTAPTVGVATTLTFSLVVTDNRGAASPASTVNITVNPPVAGNVNITGRVRYARPPFNSTFPFGFNYANAQMQPARAVVVRVRNAATQAVIATGRTTDTGDYSLTVPNNTSVQIEVVAQLVRAAPEALPAWDVTVRDGLTAAPYSFSDAAFNSSAGTRNVDIPLGIGANGQATGTRASGPFAILDSIYQSMLLVLNATPAASFPALIVDWGAQVDGTFFSSAPPQHIALMGDLTEDTDEFDRHVIAHEFGHYLEDNFSRADNIGGAHAAGDRLDPRVAFGEGFGYAFAAMVFNDPNARDSFVRDMTPNDGIDNPVSVSGVFAIETNPVTTATGPDDDVGCWCSESSVWSILWDLYDSNSDNNDSLTLGFAPIWNVLIGPQRTTPAFTTIFSFITAFKAAQPANVAAINTLVTAQNIVAATIEPFASTETNLPSPLPSNAVFPIYATATVGGPPVVVRTVDDAATPLTLGNKLANRRFVRFEVTTVRNVTITLTSSNPDSNVDPDFVVWRAGTRVLLGFGPPAASETQTITNAPVGTYLVEVYDCANGCSEPEGVAGDYDLTVTII